MPGCPPPDRLHSLVNNQLAGSDRQELEAHLTACADCQRLFEGIQATVNFLGLDTIAAPPQPLPKVAPGTEVTLAGSPRLEDGELASAAGPRIEWSLPGYEVLQELGRGGMGVVYQARQVALDRLVALKVIRSASIADEIQLARFQTEAAALAQLQHPNIVQVFAVGQHQNMPYLAMEFVPGTTLAGAIAAQSFAAKQAAEMVEKLAKAMDSAHRRGVLHRDLKPSNVLLGEDGEPKIMDFGLAKRLGSESHLTVDHTVMGTPSYMPPEQAQGRIAEIGPQSDVYSLGAILYELLTGRPPFCGTTPLDTIRQVIHREPTAPRSWNGRIPRDLETICLKCLHKLPAQRFETAADLADDLHRFLRDEPILARRIGLIGRGWRWCRRNPALSAAVTATVVVLVLGIAGFAWQSRLRRMERARGFQRYVAESAEKLQLIQDLMERVPEEQRAQDQRLQSALAAYETWLSEEPADQNAKASYADALFRIAEIRRRIGQFPQAQEMFTKSVEHYRPLVDSSPENSDLRQALAETLNWMGESYRESGQLENAVATYNEALKYQSVLAEESPDDSTIRGDLARSLYNRALALRELNRLADAEQDLRQSIQILDRPGPSDPSGRQGLARSRINLGILLSETERTVEANEEYLAAIALLKKLEEQDPQSPEYRAELAKAWLNRGNLLFRDHVHNLTNDPDPLATAEATFRLSVDKLRTLTSQFSNVPQYRKDLANSLNGLGAVLSQRQQPVEADRAWRDAAGELESLIVRSPQVADYHALLAQIHYNLALLHRRDADTKPLIDYLRDAVAGQGRAIALSPTNVLYERTLGTYERPLSRALIDSGDYHGAAEVAEQLATHATDDPRQVYAAARVLAECAVAAEQDSSLDPNQIGERATRYRATATRLLETCRKQGLAINPDDFPGLE